MKIVIFKVILIVLAYLTAILVSVYFGFFFNHLFPDASGGSFIGDPDTLNWLIGYPLSIIFLLTFLMNAYGGKHVWLWVVIGSSPAILFEILFDPLHIYFPIILGLVAWGLGTFSNKALWKLVPGFMAKIG